MARFDVFQNPDGNGFLLDVQANLLDGLNTRIVVPLMPASSAPLPAKRLNPIPSSTSKPSRTSWSRNSWRRCLWRA